MHKWPVLYFFSDVKDFTSEDSGGFVRYDELAGCVKGETGIDGLKIDFNAGARIAVPAGDWHIKITDADSGQVFFADKAAETVLISMEQYFIRWEIEVSKAGSLVFSHTYDASGQVVCFVLEGKVLGDKVMLLPYIRAFVQKWQCRGVILDDPAFREILANYYPELEVVAAVPEDAYATYHIGAFQTPPFFLPDDGRILPVECIGQELLGLYAAAREVPYFPTAPRAIAEPYVCIAVQASGARKCWLYPHGWEEVTDYLKQMGYRVICIDRERVTETDDMRIAMPAGAEDMSGDYTLMERINMLAYADFFIGLSSGLSWLAHAAGCPVVLISGITQTFSEFSTPYRVQNRQVCHGCYNDLRVDWREHKCPYHKGTDRELECSKKITPQMVIGTVERLLQDKKDGVKYE